MRPIKFRCWYLGEKPEMIEVGEIELFEDGTYNVNGELPILSGNLMQFTGLRDRHGKEIYEGDIVQVSYNGHRWFREPIIWENNGFWIKDGKEQFLPNREFCEVIGNIYENPELIK